MARILIFSLTYFPTRVGGAEVAIKEITNRLASRDLSFDLITLRIDSRLPELEKDGAVTVHRIGPTADIRELSGTVPFKIKLAKALYPFLAYAYAHRLDKEARFNGIWAMMAAYAGFAALFFKLRHPEVPYLLSLQEGDPIPHILGRVRFVRPLFNRIFTKADSIQAISTYLADWARAMKYAGPLAVVPNAVDTERFFVRLSPEERERIRAELGADATTTLMVTTSRLVHKNAVDDVIRALPEMPSSVQFLVLGTGPDEHALRALAASCGVAKRVTFMGQVRQDDLPRLLAACDIFVRASRSEGMGVSFLEAFAAGLPVIATQEGGIADFLFDEKRNPDTPTTGWAVTANTPSDIRDAVLDIMQRSDKVARVTKHALALVRERYDWATVAARMREVFNDVFKI